MRITLDTQSRLSLDTSLRLKKNEGWTPERITTYMWHDASDTSTVHVEKGVSQWDDKSGAGINVIQPTVALRPTYTETLNGLNIISVDYGSVPDVEQFLYDNNHDKFTTADMYFLILFKPIEVDDNNNTVISYSAAGPDWEIRAGSNTQWDGSLTTSDFSSNTLSYNQTNVTTWNLWGAGFIPEIENSTWFNGEKQSSYSLTTGDSLTLTTVDIRYGANRGQSGWFYGDIAECIAFPKEFRVLVEGYLAWKWGLVDRLPVGHPYKNRRP